MMDTPSNDVPAGADVVRGTEGVRRVLEEIFGETVSLRRAQWMIEHGQVPVGRLGRTIIASPQVIRERLLAAARGDAA